MPVLLLCQGDPGGKDLLRKAIEVRYGVNPPAIESLIVEFQGRARVKIGPVKTWVTLEVVASFVFPTCFRWDFVVKPLNLTIQRGVEAYDGTSFRAGRGGGSPTELKKTDIISSSRGRLWAVAALLLTPMSDHYIKISQCEENCIEAENTKLNDKVRLYLRSDYSIEYARVQCLNPETGKEQWHTLALTEEQAPIGELMLPAQINAYWDDELVYEMIPKRADLQAEFPENWFSLG